MTYVTFTQNPVSVNVSLRGIMIGFKLVSVLHSGRVISLAKNNYYYIPKTREVVSYRGAKARVMTINDTGKFNFQEKLYPRGVVPFKVDAAELYSSAYTVFNFFE